MHLIRLMLVAAVAVAGAVDSTASLAQRSDAAGARRWALSISGDAGTFPALDGGGCGERDKTVGYGGSLIYRPASRFSIEAVTRTFREPPEYGCTYPTGALETRTGANVQLVSTSFDAPRSPLMESELRIGFETPATMPLLRVSLGAGSLWHGAALPMATAAIGTGTRGSGLRVFVEVETKVARMGETMRYFASGSDSTGVMNDSSFTERTTELLHWSTLHLGVEIPLATASGNQDSLH